jgi:hypothetical protein
MLWSSIKAKKKVKGLKIKFVDFDRSKFDRDAMQEGKET